jgi:quercetin dioxygenase-like cupin family protein
MKHTWIASIAALFLAGGVAAMTAQVPLSKDPRHRVVFENAELRILDVNIPPKEITLDHTHDHDIVTVSMTGGTPTRTQSPGQPWSQPRPPRALGHSNITEYAGKPGSHRVENVGDSPYHLFAVENLRKSGWSTGQARSALVTSVAGESRAFRVYDVKLVRATPQTSHTHAVPTVVLLISGTAMSDGPDAQAKAHAPAAVGLKQLDRPGQWMLVPRGDTHHLVRLGTADAHLVEIEVR